MDMTPVQIFESPEFDTLIQNVLRDIADAQKQNRNDRLVERNAGLDQAVVILLRQCRELGIEL